jgi:predicted lactoylglutathione lyase
MSQDLWLNLPVQDLARSIAFFEQMGFERNPGPGNSERSASFLVGGNRVVLMLFLREQFAGFTSHAVSDTATGSEVLFSLGADSREAVDRYAARAAAAGGTVFARPSEANGFMYGCGFCDPDGHRWNALFMDLAKLPPR